VNPTEAEKQEPDSADLTIGDLARRTGVTPAVLRTWETRHGFPHPRRLESGHRRYAESDVALIERVLRRRDAGIRLEVAIAEAASRAPETPSVFAELRRRHPHLAPHRLRKSTLLALSWALEDECCARAQRPILFGAFQQERFYTSARPRWTELARVARATFVMADFPAHEPDDPHSLGPTRVPLAADAPMRREWSVVCDAPDLPVALAAWELPGQSTVRDRDRIFESVWTLDPRAVRDAARVCAGVAHAAGAAGAAPALHALADEPPATTTDIVAATTLFGRVVAYVDRFGH
jgi:DNA-binding transcriptional MerR regulator